MSGFLGSFLVFFFDFLIFGVVDSWIPYAKLTGSRAWGLVDLGAYRLGGFTLGSFDMSDALAHA